MGRLFCQIRYIINKSRGKFFHSQMFKSKINKLQPVFKTLLVLSLVLVLVLGNASEALAARSGGRIGGGSFRAPTRTYTAPSRNYGGGYGYGGGFGFPFLIPFFGFGGGFGGLFSILIFFAIANFLVKTVRNIASGEEGMMGGVANPKVTVAQVQVGLLAEARSLQQELNQLASTADTGTATGRAMVLQEATLALLRHPQYWVYGANEASQITLDKAEAKFNQFALGERSKFTSETISNVNAQLHEALQDSQETGNGNLVKQEQGEYILVTLVVGAQGKLNLPNINDSDDLRQTLGIIGGISSDSLLAFEVLWTPQAEGDILTTDDILANYPNLKLV